MMGLALVVTWLWVARKDETKVLPRQGAAARGRAALDGIWALLMPVGIIGGLRFGIFTPTEAGVAACVYAYAIGVGVYRELTHRMLYRLLISAGKRSSAGSRRSR
jgi:TRAP-type C4-dicarboxylate transport system permease large subunit